MDQFDSKKDKLLKELGIISCAGGSSIIRAALYSYDEATPKLQLTRYRNGGKATGVGRLSRDEILDLIPLLSKWLAGNI